MSAERENVGNNEAAASSGVASTLETLLRGFLERVDSRPNVPPTVVPGESVTLPSFVSGRDDPQRWVDEISNLAVDLGWNDGILLAKISNCFEGEAGEWFANWNPVDRRSWESLKRDLCESFAGTANFGKLSHVAINYNSVGCPSYGFYGRMKLQKLNLLRVPFTQEQLISLICFGIKDVALQAQLTQAGHLSTISLITHLSRIQVRPTSNENSRERANQNKFSNKSDIRQINLGSNTKCYTCGKFGHKQANCLERSITNLSVRGIKRERDISPGPSTSSKHNVPLICSFCKRPGHSGDKCFKKIRSDKFHDKSRDKSKHINVCFSSKNIIDTTEFRLFPLNIEGVFYNVLLDTGAQVSLIRQCVAQNMPAVPIGDKRMIIGVGNHSFYANYLIRVNIFLDNNTFAVKMHVVSDDAIGCDIIIGLDFLKIPGVMLTYNDNKPFLNFNPPDVVDTVVQSNQLDLLLHEFQDITTSGNKVPSLITTGEFKIRLTSDKEIKYRPYRLSMAERKIVGEIIEDLLKNSIIRPSQSPYASPVLLVRKKNGEPRLVCDFRALNRITVKDRFPLPRIDDQIDRLSGSKYFTTLDMAAGFHQIKVHPESVEKLAFITPDGQFEYLRMPFGLANAPSIFQRAINIALKDEIQKGIALVYLDDILIPSLTVEEGLTNLRVVLTTLRLHGFSININKCRFLQEEVEYLGRLISNGSVKPSPSKTQALKAISPPTNTREVRQFLGLAGYFRKFVPEFSVKTRIISNLLKKDESWQWTEDHDKAFNYVMNILSNEPVLAIFNPELPIELHTDASSQGFGAIILQIHDGVKRVVAYFSKATSSAESRYHSYELETLSVVYALKHFRHYFIGISFKLVTDCNSLKSSQYKRDLIPRVSRWWVYLQDFDFVIEHRAGVQMAYVDYLSRNPPKPVLESVSVNQISEIPNDDDQDSYSLMPSGWLFIQQSTDSETLELKEKLANNEIDKNQFCVIGSTLCHLSEINSEKVTQYFVPKNARYSLLKEYHDGQAHIGLEKTLLSISSHFWFPRMRQFVTKYINACLTCLTRKRTPKSSVYDVHSIPKTAIPFHTLHLDCMGPLPKTEEGFTHVFVAVDAYSKYCFLYALKSLKTDDLADCLMDIIYLVGTPTRLITDNGTSLRALQKHESLLEWAIEWHFITPYVHQANGQAERYMSFVANLLRVQAEVMSEWSTLVSRIQLIINSTVHKTTKRTPLQTLFGCDNRLPEIQRIISTASEDKLPVSPVQHEKWREFVRKRLEDNAARQDSYSNKSTKVKKEFLIGDYVLLSREALRPKKFESGWNGPYKVTNVLPCHRYELRKVGDVTESTKITSAAAHQMKLWTKEWCPEDCADVLESYMASSESSEVILCF